MPRKELESVAFSMLVVVLFAAFSKVAVWKAMLAWDWSKMIHLCFLLSTISNSLSKMQNGNNNGDDMTRRAAHGALVAPPERNGAPSTGTRYTSAEKLSECSRVLAVCLSVWLAGY